MAESSNTCGEGKREREREKSRRDEVDFRFGETRGPLYVDVVDKLQIERSRSHRQAILAPNH